MDKWGLNEKWIYLSNGRAALYNCTFGVNPPSQIKHLDPVDFLPLHRLIESSHWQSHLNAFIHLLAAPGPGPWPGGFVASWYSHLLLSTYLLMSFR